MNKKHKIKPNFLIIGAPGTATDSLSILIGQHPEGGIARAYQPSFFSMDNIYRVGWKKYLSLFEHCQGKKAIGEASTTYSLVQHFPNVVERIQDHMPRAKILYMVRHPLERIESAYVERKHAANPIRAISINEAVKTDAMILDATRYWQVFEAYRSRFDESQIKIVWFEEYAERTTEVFRDVCRFLEIDASVEPDLSTGLANPRLTTKERMALLGVQSVEVDTSWDEESRCWVIDQLREDNTWFLNHFGKPLDCWSGLFS